MQIIKIRWSSLLFLSRTPKVELHTRAYGLNPLLEEPLHPRLWILTPQQFIAQGSTIWFFIDKIMVALNVAL